MAKARFVTTLPEETIINMKVLAAKQKLNVNELIENMVKKEGREIIDKVI